MVPDDKGVPMPHRMSFNEAYLKWRNRTRRYNRDSILLAALHSLQQKQPDNLQALRNAPWLTCLLVKWVCQDRMLDHGVGPSISPHGLDLLRQMLWNLPDRTEFALGPDAPVELLMRRILRAQGGFQRRFSRGFVREAAILQCLPDSDPLRRMFRERAGLEVQTFIDLSWLTVGFLKSGAHTLTIDWMMKLAPNYTAESVAAFVALISKDTEGLIAYFRSLPNANPKKASEYFEFPALARYPFLAIHDRLECWNMHVLLRGIEGLVHAVLSEAGQEYAQRLGRAFESHIVADLRTLSPAFHDEQQLTAWLPDESEVPDGLLTFPGCNVFIEAKAGLFDESVMTVGNAEIFKHKTRSLQKAAHQAWTASIGLRVMTEVPPQIREAASDYLLVVTNKELSASNGAHLEKIYPPDTLAPPSQDATRLLPLCNIYVLSIEDFERLIAAVRAGTIHLPSFLSDCVKCDANPETSRYYFEQHLDRKKVPMGYSAAVVDALSDAERRVCSAVERKPEGDQHAADLS